MVKPEKIGSAAYIKLLIGVFCSMLFLYPETNRYSHESKTPVFVLIDC